MTGLAHYEGLTGLALSQGMAITANSAGLPCLYSDVVTHRANAAPVKGFERFQDGEMALPEIVSAVELDLSSLEARLEMLFVESLTRWGRNQAQSLAPEAGVLITAPIAITRNQLGFLGLDTSKVVIQASSLTDGLDQWQEALTAHPDIEYWYWLAIDSRCVMNWLLRQPLLYAAQTHPEGPVAGEALVLTEWRLRCQEGPVLAFAAQAPEPNGVGALREPVSARQSLMSAAEPEVAQRPPQWAECLTNDDFSRANAAERYKTEVALWPNHEADPAFGPSEPLISWYAATGDVGLATLPLGLLLARQRLDYPLHERDWVGVMINDEASRHYWRLQRQGESAPMAD